jgi:hypothetical protein
MPIDEKTLSDQISHLMNDTPENEPGPGDENTDAKKDILVESLKTEAGQTDAALDEFMEGRGVLHETTRAAITRGGSGLNEVIQLLTSQFKLSPAVAKIIASLILKMQSSVSKETAKDSTTKKKPRRKPKTASSAKKKPISSKKPKKKTAAKAKKTTSKKPAKKKVVAKAKPRSTKKTASQKAAKKKPAAKTSQKKATTQAKPKKAKRSNTVEIP